MVKIRCIVRSNSNHDFSSASGKRRSMTRGTAKSHRIPPPFSLGLDLLAIGDPDQGAEHLVHEL